MKIFTSRFSAGTQRIISKASFLLWAAVFPAALLMSGCGGGDTGQQRPPVPVAAEPVVRQDIPLYVEAIGKTSSSQSVNIVPQASGKILQIHFTQGADIKAGDPLFTIDPRPYEAALHEAQGALAKSRAELALNEETLKRWQSLLSGNYVSQQDVDGLRSKVSSGRADVESRMAAVETAKINLEYCSVRSPLDGVAGTYQVHAGNVVSAQAGQSLVNIQNIDVLYVDFTLPEGDLLQVQKALAEKSSLAVEMSALTDDSVKASAELRFIDNRINEGSGTVMLRAVLSNKARLFWPGQSVRVRVVLNMLEGGIVIPISALQYGQQGPFVFVINPDMTAQIRPVKPGQRQGENIAVLQGLEDGSRVVTSGHLMLAPGAGVIIVPQAGQPGQMPSGGAKS